MINKENVQPMDKRNIEEMFKLEHIESTLIRAHDVYLESKRDENDDQSTSTTKRRLHD